MSERPHDRVKVSVRLMCYNQEKYIAQAIESVLMQETDFDFEIVAGDDFSTDETLLILNKYEQRFPELIRVLKREKGDHYYNLRQKYGRLYNFVDIISNCRGAYVALLDGDDYWTSPYKLQRQADFLDANPDCSMCFHDVKKLYQDSVPPKLVVASPRVKKARYTFEDLLRGNLMSTCSVMFRRGLFGDFPDWFCETEMADWPFHILNARYGDIGHISSVMGVYRVHRGGVWFQTRPLHQFKKALTVYNLINVHFDGKYRKAIMKSILYRFLQLFVAWFHEIETRVGLALRRSGLKTVADIYRRIFYSESAKK